MGNVLLWGGAKNFLGFAKAAVGNLYVYPDFAPVVLGAGSGGDLERPGGAPRPLRNGWGTCAVSDAGTAAFPPPLRDTWLNNTCISTTAAKLFDFGGCNPAAPGDGHIPQLGGNTYATGDGAYELRCHNVTWGSLAAAQAAGVEAGSRLVPLPSTAQLAAAAAALLGMEGAWAAAVAAAAAAGGA